MTKEETAKLLKLLSSGFKIDASEQSVEFWHIGIGDLDKKDVWEATKYLIQDFENQYNNLTPAMLKKIVNVLRKHRGEIPDYEADWMHFNTQLGGEALARLGGRQWFGGLPDPRYSENPGAASATLNKAREQYIKQCEEILDKCDTLKKTYPKYLKDSNQALGLIGQMRTQRKTAEECMEKLSLTWKKSEQL